MTSWDERGLGMPAINPLRSYCTNRITIYSITPISIEFLSKLRESMIIITSLIVFSVLENMGLHGFRFDNDEVM